MLWYESSTNLIKGDNVECTSYDWSHSNVTFYEIIPLLLRINVGLIIFCQDFDVCGLFKSLGKYIYVALRTKPRDIKNCKIGDFWWSLQHYCWARFYLFFARLLWQKNGTLFVLLAFIFKVLDFLTGFCSFLHAIVCQICNEAMLPVITGAPSVQVTYVYWGRIM